MGEGGSAGRSTVAEHPATSSIAAGIAVRIARDVRVRAGCRDARNMDSSMSGREASRSCPRWTWALLGLMPRVARKGLLPCGFGNDQSITPPSPPSAFKPPAVLSALPRVTVPGPAEPADVVRLALAVLDPRPGEAGVITVESDPSLGAESYTLDVTAGGSADRGRRSRGSLLRGPDAAVPAPRRRVRHGGRDRLERSLGQVRDAPRFSWRGVHLDVARHFVPKARGAQDGRPMAAHKLNRLHLHLVDDQGWRVESRAYPRLHEVGSHRPRTATSYYREELAFDDDPHGGYYTLDDLAEIGTYARARAVTVVPEIDVPGHASAILAAYPELDARATGGRRPEGCPRPALVGSIRSDRVPPKSKLAADVRMRSAMDHK